MNMKTSILRLIPSLLALICVLVVPTISHAETSAEVIGKVIVSSGTFNATAHDGKTRVLKRRSSIYLGDTLVTSANGRAQIRLKDGAVIDLKSDSELKLEEYSFNGEQDGTERSTMNLLKGGFRTITGAIGKKNKKNYKVTTRIATIGIRGTHYGIHDCNGNCSRQTASGTEQVKDGLYGGVVDGKIVMQNDTGMSEFGNDQYFHLASAGEQPEYLMEPPAIVFEGNAEAEEQTEAPETQGAQDTEVVTGDGESFPDDYALDTSEVTEDTIADTQVAVGDTSTVQLDSTTGGTSPGQTIIPEPKSNTTNVYSFAAAVGGSLDVGGVVAIVDPDRELVLATDLGGQDALTSIYADSPTDTACNPCAFDVNNTGGTLVTSGPVLNVYWGRWGSGSNFEISENGKTATTGDYFHYIYTDKGNITPPTAFQTLATQYATLTYTDAGGTSPTRFDGTNSTVGTLNAASMTLDLTNQTMTQFDMNITATESWTASLAETSVPVSPIMENIKLAVDVGGASGFGVASGTFVGGAAEGFAGSYGLVDATKTKSISGTVLLTR